MATSAKAAQLLPLCIVAAVCAAGCTGGTKDDGARDLEKGRAAMSAGDFQAAATAFQACADKNPTNLEARILLSVASVETGDPRTAEEAARAAVEIDPSSAEARLAEGNAAYLAKDYKRSIEAFSAVASAKTLPAPMRSQAFSSRAIPEFADGQTDAARISLMRALRTDFRNAAAWYHLGVLSRGTLHFAAAAKDQFEMACRLDPGSPRTKEALRTVIPSLRDSLARTAADKPGAEKRNPGQAAKLLAEGIAAKRKKDLKTAADRFAKAHAADPLSWEAAWNYATTLPEAETAKKASDKSKLPAAAVVSRTLDAYRNALDAKPSSRETCIAAAKFALQNRRPAAACEFMSHALAHFHDSKAVVSLYADALERLGTSDGARRAALYRAYGREL